MTTVLNAVISADMKQLFEEFLLAEVESEVTAIIQKNGIDLPEFWIPYGNQPSNYSASTDDSLNYWGWTLICQELRPNDSSPVFTYFAPDGKVPNFEADQLDLLPTILKGNEAKAYLEYDNSCTVGIPYTKSVESGTFIKMFNYQLKNRSPSISL